MTMRFTGFLLLVIGAIMTQAAETHLVRAAGPYNSWPMIHHVGKRLVCAYSSGSAHSIDEGKRGVFVRTSDDGGKTWSGETCVINEPDVGEVTIGKGSDMTGAMLLWIRCWGGGRSHHDLYRTTDGLVFTKISSPDLTPVPMQITDIFNIPGKGLAALWFSASYAPKENRTWGILLSVDNGHTWQRRVIEEHLDYPDWPTEPSAVLLGNGRILVIARTERGGRQLQLTSSDNGETWVKHATNIRDVLQSTPSLIYDAATGKVFNYYYERGKDNLKCRKADAAFIFTHPESWPEPVTLNTGHAEKPEDAGNSNATSIDGTHIISFYRGTSADTAIFTTVVKPEDVP